MKYNTVVMIALIMGLISCEQNMDENPSSSNGTIINASTQSFDTKVVFEEQSDNTISLYWQNDETSVDKITLYNTQTEEFVGELVYVGYDNLKEGEFQSQTVELEDGVSYTALFPAVEDQDLTLSQARTQDITSQQQQDIITNLSDACFMETEFIYSEDDVVSVTFEHVYAILTFSFKSENQPTQLIFENGVDEEYIVDFSTTLSENSVYTSHIMVKPATTIERTLTFTVITATDEVSSSISTSEQYDAGYIYYANIDAINNGFITNVNEVNTFTNGDIVAINDYASVNYISITTSEYSDISTDLFDTARQLSLGLDQSKVNGSTFDFSMSHIMPSSSEGWKLCESVDGNWIELNDAVYSNGYAVVDMCIDLNNLDLTEPIEVGSYALIQIDNIFGNIEMNQNVSTQNALSAEITFTSTIPVAPTMTLVGQDNNDIVQSFESGSDHLISVLGLYNDYDNTVYVDCMLSQDVTVRTVHTIRPEYDLLRPLEVYTQYYDGLNNSNDAIYVVCGGSPNSSQIDDYGFVISSFGFDQYGKIRWVYSANTSARVFPNTYNGNSSLVSITSSSFNIFDTAGRSLSDHTASLSRAHHDAILIDDSKTIVVPSAKDTSDASLILEVDIETGDMTYIELDDIIDPDRIRLFNYSASSDDRVHVNSVVYCEEDDCYIISMRFQGVIKVKRNATSKSDIVWWMTPDTDVAEDWIPTLLTPTNFEDIPDNWNMGQHAASVLPNGDILMYDNHNEPTVGADELEQVSRIWIVRVDETDMTVTSIKDWVTPNDDYCRYMSNVKYYPESSSFVSGWSTLRAVYESSSIDDSVLFYGVVTSDSYISDTYRYYKINLYD